MTVDLASLQEGDSFAGAIVRLEKRRRLCGTKLAFLNVRQAPAVIYNCCAANDETLVAYIKTNAKQPGSFIVISGTVRSNHKIDIIEMNVYVRDDEEIQDRRSIAALYHHPGTNENPSRRKVLEEAPGELLRHVVTRYVPLEDVETCVVPVSQQWASVGVSVLQSSCQRVDVVDLEASIYNVFQSARHAYNMCTGALFRNQMEYSDFMLAGAHLCDLSLRRGNTNVFRNVYVSRNVVEALHLGEQAADERSALRTYTDSQLHFVRAACIQLSKMRIEQHQDHILRIGYALHNTPDRFSPKCTLARWAVPLQDDGLLCEEMRKAGDDLYGIDWFWQSVPGEASHLTR